MSSQNNAIDEALNSLYQVIGVGGSGVTPIEAIAIFLLGWCNVDTSEFGVHDWSARLMLRALVNTRNRW